MKRTPEVLRTEELVFGEGLEHAMSRMAQEGRALTNMVLFFTVPFIGLIYIIIFPFLGFAALARAALQRS
jgi:hypothetical protein